MSEINPLLVNPHTQVVKNLKLGDKVAVLITNKVGTMGFFAIVMTWTTLWLAWNVLAPTALQFDPGPAFVFWLFVSNCLQLFLMPLIMVGQNIQGKHSEARAKHDLAVNVKAEKEIQTVIMHLEHQNDLLITLVTALDNKIPSGNLSVH